jgi:hypothetical protein
MIVRLLITSLQNNITVRRNKIEKIHCDINKAKKNWVCNEKMQNIDRSKEEMRDVDNYPYQKG